MDKGLCGRHDDPELWFSTAEHKVAQAKSICGRCPDLAMCRDHALQNRITDGVWGGLDPVEREKILYPPRARRPRKPRIYPTIEAPEPPSDIRGVSWNKAKGRWIVSIRHRGAMHWVGAFVARGDAEAAAIATCAALDTPIVRARPGKRAA